MEFFSTLKELVAPLIMLQIVVFAAVVFVLRRLMYSASSEEINRLKKLEEDHARRTEELAAKLEAAEKQYKEKITIAEDEARRIAAQAKAQAEKIREDALGVARQESERIVAQAVNTKNKVREEIESQIAQKCAVISQEMVRKVFDSARMRLVHDGFVDETIEELEKTDSAKFSVLTEKGEILTPYELPESKKEKIASILSKKASKKISLTEKTDKSVIAGVVIKLGSLVFDGSLSERLKDVYEG